MSNWAGTTKTFADNEVLTYTDMNTYTQTPLLALGDAWTSATPNWSGSVSNPAIGNGTLTSYYKRLGVLYFFAISVTMGSTTTYGSGNWRFSLPGGFTSAAVDQACAVTARDSSATTIYALAGYIPASSTLLTRIAANGLGGGTDDGANGDSPFTWASGDTLTISGAIAIA